MNSDYVTALRVEQHRADLLRRAQEHRRAVAGRPCRPERAAASGRASRWWRRQTLPDCRPEVVGA